MTLFGANGPKQLTPQKNLGFKPKDFVFSWSQILLDPNAWGLT
jgi:hypothetical protein